ncbi:MAG: hypothetical protein HY033_04320 [Ignavibacteriae bacterium]|nr:hypothetical protein [Ignavibacteriota bacterium]
MLSTCIQVSAIVLTLGSAIFLIRGSLTLTPTTIARLSSTYFDANPEIPRNLCDQKADTIAGFSFPLFAFLLQLSNSLWPMRFKDFDVHITGVLLGIIIPAVLIFAGFIISNALGNSLFQDVQKILGL